MNLYCKKGNSIIQISNTDWAFTAYFLFKRYQESNYSSLDLLQFGGFTLVTGGLWMCLFPGTESVFYESIAKLESQHCFLKEKLEDLRISLTSAKDFRDGPLKNRGSSQLWCSCSLQFTILTILLKPRSVNTRENGLVSERNGRSTWKEMCIVL